VFFYAYNLPQVFKNGVKHGYEFPKQSKYSLAQYWQKTGWLS